MLKLGRYPLKKIQSATLNLTIRLCELTGGRAFTSFFVPTQGGIWQLKSPHPREFAIQGQKKC